MRAMPPPGSRVVYYSRFSSSRQKQTSIEGQERLCVAYAAEKQWVEVNRFSDAEKSGTTTMGRAGLFEMMAAAERGEFDVLLVEDIDRTSRDAADMHKIVKDLEELDIVICTVANGVLSDAELAFKAVHNKEFIKQNVFKSKRGQELAISKGRMSGSIPYGYRKVHKLDDKGDPINGLREIDPKKQVIVIRIHTEFDAGRTTFQICADLNADGIPGPKGKDWRPGALLGNRHGGLGILRNPIYIGEYHFRKTSRRRRKGRMKTRFTAHSERMITQHPELAIIDQDLWDRNQARLAENFDRPFHTKRKVEYVFTGKVSCGVCGSSCIVSDGKYVCTGRQQKGICSNPRRVPREAVETSIFDRIKVHVLNTAVAGPALTALREEVERARADHAARVESQTARLKAIDQEISNLRVQLRAETEDSFASQMLREDMNQLGAEKRRLEQQARRAPPPPVIGDVKAIIGSISTTLDDLHQALQADDAEAARAKELLRGLITRIVLEPKPGSVADGRGAGDMTVTVEGPMAALIDLASLNVDRVAKDGHRPMFGLDNATSVWAFSYPLVWRDPRLATVRADLPIIARLLDEADVPVSMAGMAKALGDAGPTTGPDADRSPEQRARNAVAYLQAQGFTRCVNMRGPATGYVWMDRGLSDAEWKARIAEPPMTQTIPVMRISPPEAVVVVIGPPRSDDEPAE
ncbi:MAG: recombinase family protein [Brevundimonas sp.]|uniref:recombinase family protein n=1 Tax=Brevundimonas sp. TaxID=1871086 RepID=UPI0025B9275B|nr:recombinase family protein [Brevundimonas sp.]MBX3476295.1 recombinase family protein [Brevundimonas sp.]